MNLEREPVALMGAVVSLLIAVLGALQAFDIPLSEVQKDALATVIQAAAVVAGVVWARGKVSPVK